MRLSVSPEIKSLVDLLLSGIRECSRAGLPMDDKEVSAQMTRLFLSSSHAMDICRSWPFLLMELWEKGGLYQPLSMQTLGTELKKKLKDADDEHSLMKALRLFRHASMLRILWRDINGMSGIIDTMREISMVAECSLANALDWLHERLAKKLGKPMAYGKEQKMIVLGMGKLGGNELNFSSDIDLIFCYPHTGSTSEGPKTVENHQFFSQLGQSLIRVMDTVTAEGFVFRVDMRLRPYGKSGALALSFSALEQYYQDQGRDWERYALIKARPVTGDKLEGRALLEMLKPFIYRRYLDFGAIDALRNMKSIIHGHALSWQSGSDIKRGSGGIREIEFIVQSFQLVYGGKKRQLQHQGLLKVLDNLGRMKLLAQEKVGKLQAAYLFLRRTEHLVQAWENRQTHNIPDNPDHLSILSRDMGFDDAGGFLTALGQHRSFVENLFDSLLQAPKHYEATESGKKWQVFWESWRERDDKLEFLHQRNFSDAESVLKQLESIRDSRTLKTASHQAIMTINQFMPVLLQVCEGHASPGKALTRTLPVVEKVLQRTVYLKLLHERPEALKHLVELCCESAWISNEIACYPVLLDEFLNPGNLYRPPEDQSLRDELRAQMAHIDPDDTESGLKSLCYFKMVHLLKSVIASTREYMSLMEVSNYMTSVAESIVEQVSMLAWSIVTGKYGEPGGAVKGKSPYIIVAYGKFGGYETGPDSDLDLVFIHDADIRKSTTGACSIDNQTFFVRFAQKVIHLLSLQTAMGRLYEVDVRLRPSGNSGLLVSSFKAFSLYQKETAWTWECQALIRARVIVGAGDRLARQFDRLRTTVLQESREVGFVQGEIKTMRQKMKSLDCSTPESFDIKYARGCIVDIEFLVQYMVLIHALQHPSLLKWTDNMRLLDEMKNAKLFTGRETELLQSSYLAFRKEVHQYAGNKRSRLVNTQKFVSQRRDIIKIWNKRLHDEVSLSYLSQKK